LAGGGLAARADRGPDAARAGRQPRGRAARARRLVRDPLGLAGQMRALLLAATALAACHRAAPKADEVRIQLKVEPPHLDPLLQGDAVSVQITLGDVYESLPVLAESVSGSPD